MQKDHRNEIEAPDPVVKDLISYEKAKPFDKDAKLIHSRETICVNPIFQKARHFFKRHGKNGSIVSCWMFLIFFFFSNFNDICSFTFTLSLQFMLFWCHIVSPVPFHIFNCKVFSLKIIICKTLKKKDFLNIGLTK